MMRTGGASVSIAQRSEVLVPELRLDRLNTVVPLVYGDSFVEERLQQQLQEGAVVLPLGFDIGEQGGVVVAAHSSGASSFGPYRDAFASISELEVGDVVRARTIDGQWHRYEVYDSAIVWPHEIQAVPRGAATMTLVTCWPLWTDHQRLLVHAKLL